MQDGPLNQTTNPGAREGTVIVKLVGPLTLRNIFGVQAGFRAIEAPSTIFDLSESEYMDSAGLGVLINFYVTAQKNGRTMALAGVNHRIDALLEMTRVKSLLRVFPTVAAAEQAV